MEHNILTARYRRKSTALIFTEWARGNTTCGYSAVGRIRVNLRAILCGWSESGLEFFAGVDPAVSEDAY